MKTRIKALLLLLMLTLSACTAAPTPTPRPTLNHDIEPLPETNELKAVLLMNGLDFAMVTDPDELAAFERLQPTLIEGKYSPDRDAQICWIQQIRTGAGDDEFRCYIDDQPAAAKAWLTTQTEGDKHFSLYYAAVDSTTDMTELSQRLAQRDIVVSYNDSPATATPAEMRPYIALTRVLAENETETNYATPQTLGDYEPDDVFIPWVNAIAASCDIAFAAQCQPASLFNNRRALFLFLDHRLDNDQAKNLQPTVIQQLAQQNDATVLGSVVMTLNSPRMRWLLLYTARECSNEEWMQLCQQEQLFAMGPGRPTLDITKVEGFVDYGNGTHTALSFVLERNKGGTLYYHDTVDFNPLTDPWPTSETSQPLTFEEDDDFTAMVTSLSNFEVQTIPNDLGIGNDASSYYEYLRVTIDGKTYTCGGQGNQDYDFRYNAAITAVDRACSFRQYIADDIKQELQQEETAAP